jgi:hypothetical protein
MREEAHDCASHSPPVSKLQGDSGQGLGSFGKDSLTKEEAVKMMDELLEKEHFT